MGRTLQVVSLVGAGLALAACSSRELAGTGGKCTLIDPNIATEVHLVALQHGVADQDAPEILSQNVASLEGVQCLRRLTTLDLQDSPQLTDLSPLVGHPALTTVRLSATGISDFALLGAVPHLTHVSINQDIADLSPLARARALTSVTVQSSTTLTTLAGLGAAPRLGSIDVSNTSLESFKGIEGAPMLGSVSASATRVTSA